MPHICPDEIAAFFMLLPGVRVAIWKIRHSRLWSKLAARLRPRVAAGS